MKKITVTAVAALLFVATLSYASGSSDSGTVPTPAAPSQETPAVSDLMGLDDAIEAAAAAIEGRVERGSEIAVYKITAYRDEIGDYLAEDLNDKFSMRGNLVPLARGAALQSVDTEQQFQMSGLVSDASAVGVGHYLGAKVVITGTFDRYADFSQLRLRAIDVLTSALLYSYTVRINNGDRVLANITAPFGNTPVPRVTENALDRLNRGKDLFAEGKYDEAIAEFDRALAINSDLAEAYFYKGTAYLFKGDNDRAIADLTQAIRLDPNNNIAYNNRGVAYDNKGDYDRAIADYDQAIRINPNIANVYRNRGTAYFNKEDYDRAITDHTSAIRINPNYAVAYSQRGVAHYGKDDYDRAINDCTDAIRLDPNDAIAYHIRGNAYIGKGDYDRAIADFTSAIRINPNYARAYFYRGTAYYRKGDYDRSIADYEAALRIDPNYTTARQVLEAARQELNPNNANAYYNRGVAYQEKGDNDRAIADFDQAIRLNPNYANAYIYRGIAYYNKRDYDRAIADFEAALRIDPNHANARAWLEYARQARGR